MHQTLFICNLRIRAIGGVEIRGQLARRTLAVFRLP